MTRWSTWALSISSVLLLVGLVRAKVNSRTASEEFADSMHRIVTATSGRFWD